MIIGRYNDVLKAVETAEKMDLHDWKITRQENGEYVLEAEE